MGKVFFTNSGSEANDTQVLLFPSILNFYFWIDLDRSNLIHLYSWGDKLESKFTWHVPVQFLFVRSCFFALFLVDCILSTFTMNREHKHIANLKILKQGFYWQSMASKAEYVTVWYWWYLHYDLSAYYISWLVLGN